MGNEINIPTYIITGKLKSTKSLTYIRSQFKDKKEFDIKTIEISKHQNESLRRWITLSQIAKIATEKEEEVIVICEEGHQFTKNYNTVKFISSIYEAHRLGANILLGGISGGISNLLPLPSGLFWLDTFSGANFFVIYRNLYKQILDEPFSDNDTIEAKFSEITSNKFVMYPMISTQYDFNDSETSTTSNTQYCSQTVDSRMDRIYKVYQNNKLNNKVTNSIVKQPLDDLQSD